MPRENKKRGRRADAKKRKVDVSDADEPPDAKKQRTSAGDAELSNHISADLTEGAETTDDLNGQEVEFYGLLDEDEQEYFRRADDLLEADNFPDADERRLFLDNVHKEASGKELKLACSQSCSRLMERLILVSDAAQLKSIFQNFNGHFLNLVQHRFASHVCETLFATTAPVVTSELLEPINGSSSSDQVFVTAENLFLYTVNELEPHLGFLLTDRFASHTLRVLLVVLSGMPLRSTGTSLLKSKAKESIDITGRVANEQDTVTRQVPASFTEALQKLLANSVAGLDTTSLRSLALHPIGNPTLQLLVQLELSRFGKKRAKDADSVLHKLLPDNNFEAGSENLTFVNGLLYDSVGSRLLETIVEHAPGKLFKSIYGQLFKERVGSLARNEIAGYVVCKILERLSGDDLKAAVEKILPLVPSLAERGRTNVLKTMVDRCAVRHVDAHGIAKALEFTYCDDSGRFSLIKMLQFKDPENGLATPISSQPQLETASQRHASVLAQSLLANPGPTADLIYSELISLPTDTCLLLARSPTFSHIIQQAFTNPQAPIISRRKLITRFQSHIATLAVHPSGSHLVDAIWAGTQGLAFMRQRVAEELAEDEQKLRDSPSGRKVWRNWKMDLYQKRRNEWLRQSKDEVGNECFMDFPRSNSNGSAENGDATSAPAPHVKKGSKQAQQPASGLGASSRGKSRLELARQRFVDKRNAVKNERRPVDKANVSGVSNFTGPASARV